MLFICWVRVYGASGGDHANAVATEDDSMGSSGGACADARVQVRISTGIIFKNRIIS